MRTFSLTAACFRPPPSYEQRMTAGSGSSRI
jgi:hypothetical protein